MTVRAYDLLMQQRKLRGLLTRKDDYSGEKNAWTTSGENVWKGSMKHDYFDD